jgi:hypothetical protein
MDIVSSFHSRQCYCKAPRSRLSTTFTAFAASNRLLRKCRPNACWRHIRTAPRPSAAGAALSSPGPPQRAQLRSSAYISRETGPIFDGSAPRPAGYSAADAGYSAGYSEAASSRPKPRGGYGAWGVGATCRRGKGGMSPGRALGRARREKARRDTDRSGGSGAQRTRTAPRRRCVRTRSPPATVPRRRRRRLLTTAPGPRLGRQTRRQRHGGVRGAPRAHARLHARP